MSDESTQKDNPIAKILKMIEDIANAIKGIKGTISSLDQRVKALEQKDSNAGS